jgi:MFS family permease
MSFSFLLRGVAMLAFLPQEDPKSPWTLCLMTFMMIASIGENVSLSAYFYRNLPKNIRGTLIGITTALGTLGMFLFSTIGGFMYDTINHKTPFLLVGVFDLIFFGLILSLVCLGKLDEKPANFEEFLSE